MVGKVRSVDRRLLTRRCVACGYDGELLRAGQAPQCARCGVDLSLRPARSYAEMEGLLGEPLVLDSPGASWSLRREEKIIHRWLAFLFMAMLGLIAIIFLTAALAA